MVVGAPSNHSMVAELAEPFDITFTAGVMYFRGVAQPEGTGFVTYDSDPDGSGILFLTCGATDDGVLANFQTPLSIKFGQYLLTRKGEQVETGINARRFDLASGALRECEHHLMNVEITCWAPPADDPVACECPEPA